MEKGYVCKAHFVTEQGPSNGTIIILIAKGRLCRKSLGSLLTCPLLCGREGVAMDTPVFPPAAALTGAPLCMQQHFQATSGSSANCWMQGVTFDSMTRRAKALRPGP